jgi:hypothetical protein
MLETFTHPFSWQDRLIRSDIFRIGTLYFILTSFYSLWHYEEKFIVDGYAHIFHITNFKTFVSASQREIMWLQQLVPVLLAKLGASIKVVMLSYVGSVSILYFFGFYFVIKYLKDAPSAILYLLIHYKGDPYNYFMMVEELLPGACASVVLLSTIRKFEVFPNRFIGVLFLLILAFMVVRSHPLAIICFGLSVPILFFSNRDFFEREWKLVLFAIASGTVFLITKILFLNQYDVDTLSNMKSYSESLVEMLNPSYLSGLLFYTFYTRKFFTILIGALFVLLWIKKDFIKIILILTLVLFGISIFNMTVEKESIEANDLIIRSFDSRSLQVRMIAFVAFCYFFLPYINTIMQYKVFKTAMFFLSIIGILQILVVKQDSERYLTQARVLIKECRQRQIKKAIIPLENLDGSIPIHGHCYQDIMVLSSINHADSTIQLVYQDETGTPNLSNFAEDSILLHLGYPPFPINGLDNNLYRLPSEPYRYISVNEARSN